MQNIMLELFTEMWGCTLQLFDVHLENSDRQMGIYFHRFQAGPKRGVSQHS